MSDTAESTEHTVIEAECLEDDCDELQAVTHLEHARTDAQTEFVLNAHVEAAQLHEEEAGHEFNVSVNTGTPEEMAALYEDLSGERLVADGGEPTDAEVQAAAAARNADDVPEEVLKGTPVGFCHNCLNRFEYGHGTETNNLDDCPECGSQRWEKWGYRMPDGTEVPAEDV